jgi:hypothetical protein
VLPGHGPAQGAEPEVAGLLQRKNVGCFTVKITSFPPGQIEGAL